MIACGDLDEHEEYFNPVVFDFLLFISEVVLAQPLILARSPMTTSQCVGLASVAMVCNMSI